MIFNLTQPVLDSAPKFTYTGTYEYIDDGGGNWRIKFLTSGVFTPLKNMKIDAFLVGGGAAGSKYAGRGGGGGGGYTITKKSITLAANTEYPVTIGAGGSSAGKAGGNTSAFEATANGGQAVSSYKGGNGGSGGGAGASTSSATSGNGGSDGSDGGSTAVSGGSGQGTTTREFGEESGKLYAGGGGGAYSGGSVGKGGDGGGADGLKSAEDNTGGGGGGVKGLGGSGIVVIRKHKEAAA